jgi:hypothetical protein
MTEQWEHRVEADARARLKKAIRGVGRAARSFAAPRRG